MMKIRRRKNHEEGREKEGNVIVGPDRYWVILNQA